jgi:hypothetical protein
MNLIQFLFELVRQFAPIDDNQFLKLKSQGNAWLDRIISEDQENKYLGYVKTYANEWYTQLGFGILYIIAVKWLTDALHTKNNEQDEY